MQKFGRIITLLLVLVTLSLPLVACGADNASDVPPYGGATAFTPDQATMDSFKKAVNGVKEAKLEAYTVKDDPAAVKAYYESQYKDKGWTSRAEEIADVAKQQTNQNGWALAFEKDKKVVSLVLTPASLAAGRFPNAGDGSQNVLVVISASK